jgi:hypothetical protein
MFSTSAAVTSIEFGFPALKLHFPAPPINPNGANHYDLYNTSFSHKRRTMLTKIAAVALVASASAFVPAQNARVVTKLNFEYGEYDGKLYDQDSKKDLYNKWDPNSPRSTRNFNPFETYKGNSCDASGIYPGEPRYKDPIRGDVSFSIMMAEKADAEARVANPKPGEVPGCPGCKN